MTRLFILFILFLWYSPSFAGWMIHQRSYDSSGEETKSTVYIQKNRIKTTNTEVVIYNLDDMTLTIMLPSKKVFYQSFPGLSKQDMEEKGKQMEDSFFKDLSEEEMAVFQDYKDKLSESRKIGRKKKLKVEVKEFPKKLTILDYQTRRFEIMVDNRLREEQWICSPILIQEEIDLNRFFRFMEQMGSESEMESYTSSKEYMELRRKGYPLKTVEYGPEGKVVTEVLKIEKKEIPEEEFHIPIFFREVELETFYQMVTEIDEGK